MAIEYIDGFDHFTTVADIGWSGGSCAITTTNPRTGSRAMVVGPGTAYRTFSAVASRVVGCAYRANASYNSTQIIIDLRDAGTSQVCLCVNVDGTLSVKRNGSGGTNLSTSTLAVVTGTYYYIEFKSTIANSGSYEVRVNGAVWTSGTAVDTQDTANATANQVGFGQGSGSDSNYDDIYVINGTAPNNNFLGDSKVVSYYPDGAGATAGWTPSAGSNYQCVDEAQVNGDTDYVATATVNAIDSYTFGDVTGSPTIYGVAVCLTARKDDAGARQIATIVRHSAVDYVGATTHSIGSSYAQYRENYDINPGTGVAWTGTVFNGDEFGVKCIA